MAAIGVTGTVPSDICGNCYFGVITLHDIPAFEGDSDAQISKRRAFRRKCSRAKTEAFATCLREYREFDTFGESRNGPFGVVRITDADGTWDCGGNFSLNGGAGTSVSGPPYLDDSFYDGCIFRPKKFQTRLETIYDANDSKDHGSYPEKYHFGYDTSLTYYYPLMPPD